MATVNHLADHITNPQNKFNRLVNKGLYEEAVKFIIKEYTLDAFVWGQYDINIINGTLDYMTTYGNPELGAHNNYIIQVSSGMLKYGHFGSTVKTLGHELLHVFQRYYANDFVSAHYDNANVREFLAYKFSIMENRLPQASQSNLKLWWQSANKNFSLMPSTIQSTYKNSYGNLWQYVHKIGLIK